MSFSVQKNKSFLFLAIVGLVIVGGTIIRQAPHYFSFNPHTQLAQVGGSGGNGAIVVQAKACYTGSATVTCAFDSNVTAGDTIFVVTAGNASQSGVTVSDTLGNTYNQDVAAGSQDGLAIFSTNSVSGGANTITRSGGTDAGLLILEVSGIQPSSPVDVTDGSLSGGTANAPTANSFTTTNNTDFILSAYSAESIANGGTAGSGYTMAAANNSQDSLVEYSAGNSIGSYQPGFSITQSPAHWTMVSVAYKEVIPSSFTLTYTAGANGSVTGTSPQTGILPGADGSAVTAVANSGYHFTQWSDGSTANPRTDTGVSRNISVTATFVSDSYVPPTCEAASPHKCWYIDNSLSSGGVHDGTTWETAWINIGDMNIIGGGQIHAGDFVYISGGDTTQTYTMPQIFQNKPPHYWSPNVQGSAGLPITFKIGQDAHHNGTAIFDGQDEAGSQVVAPEQCSTSNNYLTFSGNYQGQRHFTFTRLGADGVSIANCNHITISYINFDDAGIDGNNATNIEIDHNSIIFSIRNGKVNKINVGTLIHDNYIQIVRGPEGGADAMDIGEGVRIYNNTIVAVWNPNYHNTDHQDGIQTWANNVQIYNNLFENIDNSCIFFAPYPESNYNLSGVYIYNNTCINSNQSIAFGNNTGAKMYRNAFIYDGNIATSTFAYADTNGIAIVNSLISQGVLQYLPATDEVRLTGAGPASRPSELSASKFDAIWSTLTHTLYNKGAEIYDALMAQGYIVEWVPNSISYPANLTSIPQAEQDFLTANYPAHKAETIILQNKSLATAYAYVTNSIFSNNTVIDGVNGFDFLQCDPQNCVFGGTIFNSTDYIYNNLVYNHGESSTSGTHTSIDANSSHGNNISIQEPTNTHFAKYTYTPRDNVTIFNPSDYDVHLVSSATDLIGLGTNLSQYFTTDITGVSRPSVGSAWDIG
ncbi:MAG: hypothetical protein WCQ60_02200, partial [bacterium]